MNIKFKITKIENTANLNFFHNNRNEIIVNKDIVIKLILNFF